MNKRRAVKYLKFAIIGLVVLLVVGYLASNIAVSRYKTSYRQMLVSSTINKIEIVQNGLTQVTENGNREILRLIALDCSSFGGYMGGVCDMDVLSYVATQGGWNWYASAFSVMALKSGEFDEREISFLNQAYELNASMLSSLTAKEYFSDRELSNLIGEFAYDVQKLVFAFL